MQWYPVDSGMFAIGFNNKTLQIIDSNGLRIIDIISLKEDINWFDWSDRSKTHNLVAIALGPLARGRSILVDPIIGTPCLTLQEFHSELGVSYCTWSLNEPEILFTSGFDGRILCWDIRFAKKPIHSFTCYDVSKQIAYKQDSFAHQGSILSLRLSSDGKHLFSWGGAGRRTIGSLKMWSSDTRFSTENTKLALRNINFGLVDGLESMTPSHFTAPTNRLLSNRESVLTLEDIDINISNSQFANSQTISNISLPSPIRMASFQTETGGAWDGSMNTVFVPAGKGLFSVLAGQRVQERDLTTRHHDRITACVWNNLKKELYTASLDGNLFVWPLIHLTMGQNLSI